MRNNICGVQATHHVKNCIFTASNLLWSMRNNDLNIIHETSRRETRGIGFCPASRSHVSRVILCCLTLFVIISSCQKPVEYPVEPAIEYQGFTYLFNADSTFTGEGVIAFSYTDGDGDLGLDDADTLYPFGFNDPHYYNMVVDYLKSENGVFVKVPLLSPHVPANPADTLVLFDTVTFNARFHRLRDNDDPKAISGTMEYKLTVQNPFSPNDTVKFEIHILDRALHESNTIQTEAIYTNPTLNK